LASPKNARLLVLASRPKHFVEDMNFETRQR